MSSPSTQVCKECQDLCSRDAIEKRVGAWQSGLAPLLVEQDKWPEFDIHGCGRQILQTVERNPSSFVRKGTSTWEKKLDLSSSPSSNISQKNKNTVGFLTIFPKDCEDYEVYHLFLSVLMLYNCSSVTMHKNRRDDDGGIESLDPLNIELLESTFQPSMESFVAPSASRTSKDLQWDIMIVLVWHILVWAWLTRMSKLFRNVLCLILLYEPAWFIAVCIV